MCVVSRGKQDCLGEVLSGGSCRGVHWSGVSVSKVDHWDSPECVLQRATSGEVLIIQRVCVYVCVYVCVGVVMRDLLLRECPGIEKLSQNNVSCSQQFLLMLV